MFVDGRVCVGAFVHAWAHKRDKLVAAFVYRERADLTLKALFAKAPYEVFAVRAEGGLFEEAGAEFVVFYFEDIFLSDGTASVE